MQVHKWTFKLYHTSSYLGIDTGTNKQLVIVSLAAGGIILILLAISVFFLLLTFASKRARWNSQVQLVTRASSDYSEPAVLVLKTDLESASQFQIEKSEVKI